MLQLGNVKILAGGAIVVPPQCYRAIGSIMGLFCVILLEIPFFFISFRKSHALFGVFFALSVILFFVAAFLLAKTAFTDPGIIPGREFQDYQIAHLKGLLAEKQRIFQYQYAERPKYTLNLNLKAAQFQTVPETQTPAYKAMNSNHSPMTPLKFSCLDYQFTAKYCQTCRFYRPLRATHGSKSNCCIQRYDHFCAWIGGDVGLHNLGWFYYMLGGLVLDLGFSLLFAVFSVIYCGVNYKIDVVAFSFALVFGLAQIGFSGYLLFSIAQLIGYHYYLLKTGALTKEDSGPENANIAGPFSMFDVMQNMRMNSRGMNYYHVLRKVLAGHAFLVQLAVHNPYVTSFESLGRVLGMQGYQQFTQTRADGLDGQSINCKLRYENVFTARDGAEYAICRARQMVITSRKTLEQVRTARPELFELKQGTGIDGLSLVKCCNQKAPPATQKSAQAVRYPEPEIQAAGI